MAKVSNWPLNYAWAELTGNKLSFTQTEVSAGITYKGPIVSNQLNGISFLLSRILQFNQVANGYYHPNMTYHKGNFVSIVHTGSDHPMQLETYVCINDNNGKGITNQPPLLAAMTTDVNGITQYAYGVVDSQYWKRIDVGDSQAITPVSIKNASRLQTSDENNFCALLMSIPDISFDKKEALPSKTKKIEADLSLTCKCGDNWSTVNFRIKGKYLRDDASGTYVKPNDYFNMPVPDIYIDDIQLYTKNNESYTSTSYVPSTVPQTADRANLQSANQSPSKDQLMNGQVTPYGFNFVIGYTADVSGKRDWGIYIVSKESTEFELEGRSTLAVGLNQISDTTLTVMNVIPVRPNGGANSYGQLLELVEYDEISANYQNPLLFFSRGQVELERAQTVNNTKFSCYKILARMQTLSVGRLKEHTGRHTRAYGGDAWETDGSIYAGSKPGDLLEPGLPNITMTVSNDYSEHRFALTDAGKRLLYINVGAVFNSHGLGATNWDFDASRVSLIYKNQFADVNTKAISISRYVRIF